MPKRIVSQARSFKENPNHYPRKLKVRIYNAFTKKEPNYSLPENFYKLIDSYKLNQSIQIIGGIYSSSEKSKFCAFLLGEFQLLPRLLAFLHPFFSFVHLWSPASSSSSLLSWLPLSMLLAQIEIGAPSNRRNAGTRA